MGEEEKDSKDVFETGFEFAKEIEKWKADYNNRVNSLFRNSQEEKGKLAFKSWEDGFLNFLNEQNKNVVQLYHQFVPKVTKSKYLGETVYDHWMKTTGKNIEAFLDHLIEEAHDGRIISQPIQTAFANTGENLNISQKKIFIGHGRSPVWKDLRDFLEKRLNLNCEEFNSEPSAGLSTKERLEEMLGQSYFAFIVMTAEDEHNDGKLHARNNVIHEAGLFQGKLGFRRAIILLEDTCEEFSNITGLVQIRFSKGNIISSSEEIRRVLEREGLIK